MAEKASKKKVSKKKTTRKKTSRKPASKITAEQAKKEIKTNAEKAKKEIINEFNKVASELGIESIRVATTDGVKKANVPIATYSDSPSDRVGRNPDPQSEQRAKEVLAIVKYYREQIKTKSSLIEALELENEALRKRVEVLKGSVENFENSIDEHLVTIAEERVLGEDDLVNSLTSLFYYPKSNSDKQPPLDKKIFGVY